MSAVLVAILSSIVVGLPITLAVDRNARGAFLLALAILYGTGAVWLALMLLALLHVSWTLLSVTIALLAIATAASAIVGTRDTQTLSAFSPPQRGEGGRRPDEGRPPQSKRLHPFDALTAIVVAGFGAYASAASPAEWDFWILWGLKGRVFFEHRGIDWRFLQSGWNDFAHGDYPLLLPMNYTFTALLHGGWSDRWVGLLFLPWVIAILLIVRVVTSEETTNAISAAATLAAAPAAISLYVGMAEGVFIAYAGAALLLVRRALRDDGPADWRHGALLLGLAANCKNEGLALVAVTALGVLAAGRQWQRVIRLWPAVLLAAPWLLMRAVHTLPTDIAKSGVLARLGERLAGSGEILTKLDQLLVDRWAWAAILATFLIIPKVVPRERFLLVVTFVQLAVYIGVYFITPLDLEWHIATSWPRLPRQLQIPITVVCVMALAQFVWRGEDAPHAEARPDQQ